MADLDDLILDQTIRRRLGEPGTVRRVDRTAESPMGAFRALAERVSGGGIVLVAVTDGIPGHFSLRGPDGQTVVFHERQLEVCAFLYGITLDQRLEARLREDVFEATVLRLIAEFLLQRGHGDQAISTLAKSRRVQGGLSLYGPIIGDLEDLERDERYMVEWFFALGHEIGHNLAPELARDLEGLEFYDADFIEDLRDTILDRRFSQQSKELLEDIIRRGDVGDGPLSHASVQVLREEAVADLFSLICMSEAWSVLCSDRVGRDYFPHRLLFESIVSMSSVMVVEQCRMMVGWFSSMLGEVESQPLMLAGVAFQVRMNLLPLTVRDPGVQEFLTARYPSFAAFAHLDEAVFSKAMRFLQARSLELGPPFERARYFLSSTEFRDARHVQDYLESVASDRTEAHDARTFLRVARHLDSPWLDAMHDVVDGGQPPIVTPR